MIDFKIYDPINDKYRTDILIGTDNRWFLVSRGTFITDGTYYLEEMSEDQKASFVIMRENKIGGILIDKNS